MRHAGQHSWCWPSGARGGRALPLPRSGQGEREGDLLLAVLRSALGVLVRRAIALSTARMRSVADKLKGGIAGP